MKNTHTGKCHQENSTVLCWIHSHVEGKSSYLSSIDLHHHHILQETFPNIQALIVDISGNFWNSHEFYNLSQHGKEQLSRCLKKPHTFHAACSRSDFYQIANPKFDDLPLVVNSTFQNLEFLQPSIESNVFYENVTISNLDGQDDLSSNSDIALSDPCPMFEGKRFMNRRGYICYLNSVVNGLLSLKSFRKMIKFMEDIMKNFFTNILNDEMRNLERLRVKLNRFNPNFPYGTHSDACEALNQLILLMNLDDFHQMSHIEIKRKQKCTDCDDESSFSVHAPHGSPNILILEQSYETNIQGEVDNYIRNLKNVHSEDAYCTNCQGNRSMTLSDCLQTHDILMIRTHRFSDNFIKIEKEITPTYIIQIGSKRYKLKCYISHHGQSAEVGHYTSTIPLQNNILLTFDDELRIEKTEFTKDPYILFYERIDSDNDESEDELNDLFECQFCDKQDFTNQQSLEKHQAEVHQSMPNDKENILGFSESTEDTDPVPLNETTGPSPMDVDMSDVPNTINESGILNLESDNESIISDDISQVKSKCTFIYPKGTIEQFTKIASKHKKEDGARMPVFAYLAGYRRFLNWDRISISKSIWFFPCI